MEAFHQSQKEEYLKIIIYNHNKITTKKTKKKDMEDNSILQSRINNNKSKLEDYNELETPSNKVIEINEIYRYDNKFI